MLAFICELLMEIEYPNNMLPMGTLESSQACHTNMKTACQY